MQAGTKMIDRGLPALLILGIFGLCGCGASTGQSRTGGQPASLPPAINVSAAAADCRASPELQQLWRDRTEQTTASDYPIGPGDLLRITVVGIDQLEKQEVRVTGDGTVTFPFAGTVPVAHMTDEDLERELERRLRAYIHDPEVSVFDEEDKSRTIRVMGLVNKPGLIVLTSQTESIMDTIAEAGGLRDDASQRILFIPSAAIQPAPSMGNTATTPNSTHREPSAATNLNPALLPHVDLPGNEGIIPAMYSEPPPSAPIVMNMHDDTQRSCLELPARPGDTVIVPVAGNVTVEGWVRTPGAVNLTPGMTVLGAIAAAGGALFSSNAEILRSNADSQRVELTVNLSAIEAGTASDLPLEAGDVVVVEHSVVGAVPYAVYSLLGHLSPGLAIPIP
jgi:protein involved in polysaccharide export with SLBB domain